MSIKEKYPIIKKYSKWILSLIITLWIYFTYYTIDKIGEGKKLIAETNKLLNIKTEEAESYKDKYGKEHLRAEKLQIDRRVFEVHNQELARQLGLKPKQIQRETKIETKLEFVHIFDTAYVDNYIEIEKKGDSIYLSATDTLTLTEYWKRNWFLGRKRYYADISNTSPYVKLKGLSSIEVKKKDPKVIIGPSIGYNPFLQQPIYGICLIYYPLSLKL